MTLRPNRWLESRPLSLVGASFFGLQSLLIAGCGSAGLDGNLSAAQVRFVEVSPGSPGMDLYVNGSGAAYGLGYANFTSYLPVSSGPVSLSAHRAGTGQMLSIEEGTLNGGRQYTVVVSHGLANLQQRIYQDQDTPAPMGQAAVRVLNEVEGIPGITIYVTPNGSGGPSATTTPASVLNLGTGAASGYVGLPSGASYTVTATMAVGALNLPLGSTTLKVPSGSVRTVVFAGTAQATGGRNIAGFVLDDVDTP